MPFLRVTPRLARPTGAGAVRAGPLHRQAHHAARLVEAHELYVAPVLLHRRPDARLQDLFYERHRLAVVFLHLRVRWLRAFREERLARVEEALDLLEHLRLQRAPVRVFVLADRDVVLPVEDPGDAVDAEEPLRQRRAIGKPGGREVVRASVNCCYPGSSPACRSARTS